MFHSGLVIVHTYTRAYVHTGSALTPQHKLRSRFGWRPRSQRPRRARRPQVHGVRSLVVPGPLRSSAAAGSPRVFGRRGLLLSGRLQARQALLFVGRRLARAPEDCSTAGKKKKPKKHEAEQDA